MPLNSVLYSESRQISPDLWRKCEVSGTVDDGENLELLKAEAQSSVHDWFRTSSNLAPIPADHPFAGAFNVQVTADKFKQPEPVPIINRREIERLEMLIDNAEAPEELQKHWRDDLPEEIKKQFAKKQADFITEDISSRLGKDYSPTNNANP